MGLQIFGVVDPKVSEMATAMNAKFKDALIAVPEVWSEQVSGFTSTGVLRQKFPIDLTSLDGFREWVGERDYKDSDIDSFFIDSKPWERSITVPLDVAKSGQFDAYVNKVPALVMAAKIHRNRLIASLLQNGESVDCWDGKKFFAADHPVNTRDSTKGTWINIRTAKPFSRANFKLAKKYFREFKAPDGTTSIGARLTHVIGDTSLEETFDELFKKKLLANDAGNASDDNIYYQGAVPIIAPELDTEPGVWYGIAANLPGAMPMETQMRDGGTPEIMILGDGTEHAAKHNTVAFLGKLFGNAGYAIPHTIIRFEPT